MNPSRNCLLTLGLTLCLGCGATEPGSGKVTAQPAQPTVQMVASGWTSPVTIEDVDNFLTIIQRLPDQRVPLFTRADLALEPVANESLDEYIANLRASLRDAINPEQQGAEWQKHKEIAAAFRQLQISPEDFAALATKMSMAWSAAAVRGAIPILATQRRIGEQLQKLSLEMQHASTTTTDFQRKQQLQSIQELVALGEFIEIIKNVPDASIEIVRANASRLGDVLPPADLSAQFEKFHESSPSVIRVGHALK